MARCETKHKIGEEFTDSSGQILEIKKIQYYEQPERSISNGVCALDNLVGGKWKSLTINGNYLSVMAGCKKCGMDVNLIVRRIG